MTDSLSLFLCGNHGNRPVSITTAAGWKLAASVPLSKRVSRGKKRYAALIKTEEEEEEEERSL